MKSKLLYTFITAILLVPLYGVQAMAQDYKLPNNSGTVKMSVIFRENPDLKGKKIYGDLQRDEQGNPKNQINFYGGTRSGALILNNPDRYGADNPGIEFKRDSINGLTLISRTNEEIKGAILFLAEYKEGDGWCKSDKITLSHQNISGVQDSNLEEQKDSTEQAGSQTGQVTPPIPPVSNSYPWWAWLLDGFLFGVVLSFILMWKIFFSQKERTTSENGKDQNLGKQPTLGEKSLNKIEVEQIVNKIAEKHSSELFAKISKLVDEKFISSGSEKRVQLNSSVDGYPVTTAEKRTQNTTIPNGLASSRNVKETRKIQKVETEEFCGYAQLPQNGDFALTLTQDPARTAFVISKRGSNYLVGLIDDEQTLSQLVQPLSDLKANGSNIVDFPEGELQGAQKIVCVDRGIFKEESTGRIIPVKPIQIKRG